MPIHLRLDRENILADFPWMMERDQNMIVGTDLDAILSSALAHQVMGWKIAGYYDLTRIYYSGRLDELWRAVWVDLDISHRSIKSIGHHILTVDDEPMPFHKNALNLNIVRGVTMATYKRKYPLGTFHFLLWLWEIDPPLHDPYALPLYWLPDSAYANGQSDSPAHGGNKQVRRYRENVLNWVNNCIPIPALIQTLDEIDTNAFEGQVAGLVPVLQECGWQWGSGSMASRFRQLRGGQCRFNQPDQVRLNRLHAKIAEITGWDMVQCPTKFSTYSLTRTPVAWNDKVYLDDVLNQVDNMGLSQFVKEKRVFSYAIPYRDQINYTVLPPSGGN